MKSYPECTAQENVIVLQAICYSNLTDNKRLTQNKKKQLRNKLGLKLKQPTENIKAQHSHNMQQSFILITSNVNAYCLTVKPI